MASHLRHRDADHPTALALPELTDLLDHVPNPIASPGEWVFAVLNHQDAGLVQPDQILNLLKRSWEFVLTNISESPVHECLAIFKHNKAEPSNIRVNSQDTTRGSPSHSPRSSIGS